MFYIVKPWPNECNIAIHHRWTLLNATCWTRLATMLYHVTLCCIMLHYVASCCIMLHHVALCCIMLNEVWFPSNISCNIVQHFCTRTRCKSSFEQEKRVVWSKIRDHYSSQIFDLHNSSLHRTTCCMSAPHNILRRSTTSSNKVEFNNVE